MTYCTQQDLVDRFGSTELVQLTDRTNKPATTIDANVVSRALADADALIDSYLRKLYTLPLATVPAILVKEASDVARYFLHGKAAEKGTPVEIAYRDALDWLADVAQGTVVLETGGVVSPVADGGQVRSTASDRVVTTDSMKGFV